ncbi:MAG: XTP/dITP diphosphatase [Chloroflexi bacterium]|nr:XTP/dITP diphosphatase [Chloroflexota bacterium]
MHKLLLATNNQGKVQEYRSLLAALPFKLLTPDEVGITTVVAEVGETLEENARLKATILASESGLLTLADDSGLEVDALGGEPGSMSARYAGEDASDRDRVNFLLSRLKDVPRKKRTARFRCVIAIAIPNGEVTLCSGECRGLISFKPEGDLGFGYDPVFYLPEMGKTMAELPPDIKNQISHRGQAARKAVEILRKPPFSTFGASNDHATS